MTMRADSKRVRSSRIRSEKSSGNVFADLGLPHPEQELLKARLTLQIYRLIKARGLKQADAGKILGQAASRLGADAQPVGSFFCGAADGISYCAGAGCGDYREADAEGAGRGFGGGIGRREKRLCRLRRRCPPFDNRKS